MADNLARWREAEVDYRPKQGGIQNVSDAGAFWRSMELSYNASHLIANRPNTFTTIP